MLNKVLIAVYLIFATINKIYANKVVIDLFTQDLSHYDSTVVFEKTSGDSDAIGKLKLYYLSSSDCQSGFQAYFDSTDKGHIFPITNNIPFGLLASSVYQVGLQLMSEQQVEQTHSILIRPHSTSGKLYKFLGTCADQQINCCIPVQCSNQTGTCLAEHVFETQTFESLTF